MTCCTGPAAPEGLSVDSQACAVGVLRAAFARLVEVRYLAGTIWRATRGAQSMNRPPSRANWPFRFSERCRRFDAQCNRFASVDLKEIEPGRPAQLNRATRRDTSSALRARRSC